MERIVDQQYAELIGEAISAIPYKIMEIIKPVHFFTGTDPFYAGLEVGDDLDIPNGRSWKTTMHYLPIACQLHLPRSYRCPTIVMPLFPEAPGDVVHELGHALDDRTMWYQFQAHIIPVTEYAKTNGEEAFAEAFATWLFWDYGNFREPDVETLSLFRRLVRGD
jgi:hypothetical protein